MIEGSDVVSVWTWEKSPEPRAIYEFLRQMHVGRIAIEDWTRRGNDRMGVTSWVTLVSRGVAAQAAAECAGCVVLRPTVTEWRRRVLGLSPTVSGANAKRAAEWACWGGGWARVPVSLGLVWPDGVERTSHAAEATCLAVDAQRGAA